MGVGVLVVCPEAIATKASSATRMCASELMVSARAATALQDFTPEFYAFGDCVVITDVARRPGCSRGLTLVCLT